MFVRRRYDDCFRFNESKYEDCLKKLLKSDVEVPVSSVEKTEKKHIQQIIQEAQKAGKAVIFTFTPGPFKKSEDLPNDWMNINPAVGCTAQLNAFEKAFKDLNAVVLNVNTQSSENQCGQDGLLAVKKLDNLLMISDEDGTLQKALGLYTLTIPDNRYKNDKYLERFTIVIKPNNEAKVFEVTSPVNDMKANYHIQAIEQFLAPQLQEKAEVSYTGPVV